MTENFKKQLRWFTQKLIAMRVLDIDGYHELIDFDPGVITTITIPAFDAHRTPQEHALHMLREMRGEIIKDKLIPPTEVSFRVLTNGHIEISGYETELLRKYFVKKHGGSESLFGEGRDANNHTTLTYCEQLTDVVINGNELAVFRRLLRGWGGVVSFEELREEIENMHHLEQPAPLHHRERTTVTETQKTTVRSAVSEVKEKLKIATGYTDYPEIIKSERGEGYKMIL